MVYCSKEFELIVGEMGCVTNRANSAEPAKPGSSTDPNASKTPAITINNKALTDTNNKAFTAAKDTYAGSAAQVNNFGN